MGQGNEMTYQGTRQDDGRPQQQVVVLREEGNQHQHHDVKKHDAIEQLSRTDLVVVALPQEMHDARHGEDYQESVGQIVRERYAVVGTGEVHCRECLEVAAYRTEIALVKEYHQRQPAPVGRKQSRQRGDEGAQAEAAEEDHQDPVDGDERQQMHLGQARQSENEEGVVGPSRRLAVLVGHEECQQARNESHSHQVSCQRGEDEARHTREDDEGGCRRPAVDADQGIEVVELDHQIGRQGIACQLEPPLVLYDTADEAEHQSVDHRHRKGKTASGYNLL